VVAETPSQAADAAEAVLIDYEPLSALVDVSARRCEGSPPTWAEALVPRAISTRSMWSRPWDMPLSPEKVWRAIREAPLK